MENGGEYRFRFSHMMCTNCCLARISWHSIPLVGNNAPLKILPRHALKGLLWVCNSALLDLTFLCLKGRVTPTLIRTRESEHVYTNTGRLSAVVICLQLIKYSCWISREPTITSFTLCECAFVCMCLCQPSSSSYIYCGMEKADRCTHIHTRWISPSDDQVIVLLCWDLSSGYPWQRREGRAKGWSRGREEDDQGWNYMWREYTL